MAMPQEVVPKQAPPTPVVGGYDYEPSSDEVSRVRNFLTTYDSPAKPSSVVIVPNDKWNDTLYTYQIPATRGRSPAFSLWDSRRVYMNANAFKQDDPSKGPEWLLAHESQHFSDSRSTAMQEKFDKEIDAAARDKLKDWIKQQKKPE